MKINLKDVKQLEVDKACQSNLHCNTVDKSNVSQYKDGKFKATVMLADETDVLTAYVYDMEVLDLFFSWTAVWTRSANLQLHSKSKVCY